MSPPPRRFDALWSWIAAFSSRRSREILALTLLVSAVCGVGLSDFHSETDLDDFVREPARELSEIIEQDFDEGSQLTLVFESLSERSLFEPELLKQQLQIMRAIGERFDVTTFSLAEGLDKGLTRIKRISLMDVEDYTPIAQAMLGLAGPGTVRDLAAASRHLVSHPDAVMFYAKLRLAGAANLGLEGQGADETAYGVPYVRALKAFVRVDADYSGPEEKAILEEIPRIGQQLASSELAVRAINDKLTAYELDARSQENVWRLGLVALLVDFACIWLLFRSRRELALVGGILGTSALWSFGFAALAGMRFSFFHLVALPILLGTGIDDTFVFGRRMAEERARGLGFEEALQCSFRGSGNAIALTTFTTLIAFLITGLTATNPITTSFFRFVALSMAVVFVLTTFLQGAVRTELQRWDARRGVPPAASAPSPFETGTRALAELSARTAGYARAVPVVCGLVLALSVAGATRLEGGSDPHDLVKPGMQTYAAQHAIDQHFTDSRVGYVLFEGAVESPELLVGLEQLHRRLAGVESVEQVLGRANLDSVVDLLEKRRIRIHAGMDVGEALDLLAQDTRTADYVLDRSFAEHLGHVARRDGEGFDGLLLRFWTVGGNERSVQATAQAIRAALAEIGLDRIPDVRIRIGGGDVIYGLEAMHHTRALYKMFAGSLMANWLLLLCVWRRVWISLAAIAPVVLAVACLLGLMGAFGVTLAVMTVSVGAIAVGLGIDYPIHIIERFEEERRRGLAPSHAAEAAVRSMGPHILASSLTTIFGFAAACVLALPMAVSFGLLTGAAILLVYLTSMLALPTFLVRLAS